MKNNKMPGTEEISRSLKLPPKKTQHTDIYKIHQAENKNETGITPIYKKDIKDQCPTN